MCVKSKERNSCLVMNPSCLQFCFIEAQIGVLSGTGGCCCCLWWWCRITCACCCCCCCCGWVPIGSFLLQGGAWFTSGSSLRILPLVLHVVHGLVGVADSGLPLATLVLCHADVFTGAPRKPCKKERKKVKSGKNQSTPTPIQIRSMQFMKGKCFTFASPSE